MWGSVSLSLVEVASPVAGLRRVLSPAGGKKLEERSYLSTFVPFWM